MIQRLLLLIALASLPSLANAGGITCDKGRMFNPISDVCWGCIFPIKIGNASIAAGQYPDEQGEGSPIGRCPVPPPIFQRIGMNVSYWEPYTLVDVVKEPYCMESLAMSLHTPNPLKLAGTNTHRNDARPANHGGFYQVHWYKYPIFAIFGIINDVMCATAGGLDIAYMTEYDPLWNDEDAGSILHPEIALFNNPIAALSCVPDAVKTLLGNSSAIDALFWCQGSQGLSYPFTGQTSQRKSGLSNAVMLMERFNMKLHRQGFVNETHSGNPANCIASPDLMLPKSRYRWQMSKPTPSPDHCYPYGTPTIQGELGRNNPFTSRDNYGFVTFRKHSCMAF